MMKPLSEDMSRKSWAKVNTQPAPTAWPLEFPFQWFIRNHDECLNSEPDLFEKRHVSGGAPTYNELHIINK